MGFSSTRSIHRDLLSTQCEELPVEKVLIIDLNGLRDTLFNSGQFNDLAKSFPLISLFEECYDFDIFYDLLGALTLDNPGVYDDATQERLSQQGVDFVDLYRNQYLAPHLTPLNAMNSFFIKAITPNFQCFVVY